jgi:cobalt-zinc-cadmium efflux system protein
MKPFVGQRREPPFHRGSTTNPGVQRTCMLCGKLISGMPHHDHHHHRPRSRNKRRLVITLGLAAAYMLAEVVGGLITNSLALLADAGHMLADVAALALSLMALWIAERPPSPRRTYGYYRAEILAALANGATLIAIALFIFVEALKRFREPPPVLAGPMLAIAAGGLAVNLVGLAVLSGGKQNSLNIRGAWLHVLTDALGSVGAIAAAATIWTFGWYWIDPAISIAIGLLVIYSAWALVKESVAVLMESVPHGIDIDEVQSTIAAVRSVIGVHDLHIWSITTGRDALSAHVVTNHTRAPADLLSELRSLLHDRYGIDQLTIQIEPPEFEECQQSAAAGP